MIHLGRSPQFDCKLFGAPIRNTLILQTNAPSFGLFPMGITISRDPLLVGCQQKLLTLNSHRDSYRMAERLESRERPAH